MFDCKVCNEKDKRIDDLLSQVSLLQRLVFPTPVSNTLPTIDLDAVGEESQPSPTEYEEIQAEADRILSGNY
jgi:hypothetical protein